MRAAVAANPEYPRLLFVFMGFPQDGESFFTEYWPEATALCDGSQMSLYRAFGLQQGTASQMMNFGVISCSIRAIGKGNIPGKPVGDPRQMPGLFLVQGERVLWQRDYAHAGDSPNWERLPDELQGVLARVAEPEAAHFDVNQP